MSLRTVATASGMVIKYPEGGPTPEHVAGLREHANAMDRALRMKAEHTPSEDRIRAIVREEILAAFTVFVTSVEAKAAAALAGQPLPEREAEAEAVAV